MSDEPGLSQLPEAEDLADHGEAAVQEPPVQVEKTVGRPRVYEDVLDDQVASVPSRDEFMGSVFPEARPSDPRPSRVQILLRRFKGGGGARTRAFIVAGAMFFLGSCALLRAVGGGGEVRAARREAAPFGRGTLIAADAAGVSIRPEDIVPPADPVETPATMVVAAQPEPAQAAPASRPRPAGGVMRESPSPARREVIAREPAAEVRRAARPVDDTEGEEVIFADGSGVSGLVVVAPQEPPRALVNLGRTFLASLNAPAYTGAAPGPASAIVAEDVRSTGGDIVVPSGSSLHGDAFVMYGDEDRVHILWRSVVINGQTLPISALAMGTDYRLGIPGKLIRKGSKKKKWGTKGLASLGSAMLYSNVMGVGGVPGRAAQTIGSDINMSLSRLSSQMEAQRDDRVVEASAGATLLVYLQADFQRTLE